MKVTRIKINTWTSSFRFPNLMSAFQPTLDVPPISTIMGLINAAAGYYIQNREISLGYYFEYSMKSVDLESIYQISLHRTRSGISPSNIAIPNVIQREFLYDCQLYLFLADNEIIDYFYNPRYPLLLGRSSDLAGIESIKEVEIDTVLNAKLAGQVIPFNGNYLPGVIQALPRYFTNTIPRKNIGTEPFSVISYDNPINSNLTGYKSNLNEFDSDLFFHHLRL